jgi:hypothetical protein
MTPTSPQSNLNSDRRRSYCVAVIYGDDAVEIEVLALSSLEAMDVAEVTASSELPTGWKELVLICEPEDTYTPIQRTYQ